MSEYNDIVKKINEYISIKERKLIKKKIYPYNNSFAKVRDQILGVGKIIEEDFENQIYIVVVMSGWANMNMAFVGIKLGIDKLVLVGYAEEGILGQHTAENAVIKLEKALQE